MKILIASDAGPDQINGVVTTLTHTIKWCEKNNHEALWVHPGMFKTIPCPSYPEIKLAVNVWKTFKIIGDFKPDYIHIATEGPIGLATKLYCWYNGISFSTSYHTKFPEYINQRYKLPLWISYKYMQWFHNKSKAVLVTTETIKKELLNWNFKNLIVWSRGVDIDLFKPERKKDLFQSTPVWLNVGRVSCEKNLEDFLSLDLPGLKVIVGDGPDKERLKNKFPEVVWAGKKTGVELAEYYASADYFVFPSKTDTFGLVILEAMASGLPVAAFPVPGPIDIINDKTGIMKENLYDACSKLYTIKSNDCRQYAEQNSWDAIGKRFFDAVSS